ncbi:PRD domain-containing protein [Pseudoclavibacter helvolus]|uniref:PRD domain-containing protein n=1 Tax=Pseudoclavibacter helvolus TaxID=255205 RepID=UPI00373560F2
MSAVDEAERMLGRDLGKRLPLAIIDHIQYVLERLDQGIRIPATSMPELRVLHPQEFAASKRMSASISAALGRELPPEEAVFLTMHVLNSTRDEPDGTSALLFRRVQHVVVTVEAGLGVDLDVDSHDYARFVLHIQFLLQWLVFRSMLRSTDSSFFDFTKRTYPRSFAIAEQVKSYVREATGFEFRFLLPKNCRFGPGAPDRIAAVGGRRRAVPWITQELQRMCSRASAAKRTSSRLCTA